MNKRTKIIIGIAILLAVITVAACILPFPEKIELSLQGAQVTEDGAVSGGKTVRLQATKYHFLLKEDTYHWFSVEINGVTYDISGSNTDVASIESPDGTFEWFTYQLYCKQLSSYLPATVVLDNDLSWCAISIRYPENDVHYYVCSGEEEPDFASVWDICKDFLG